MRTHWTQRKSPLASCPVLQADSDDGRMLFASDDEVCGVPVAVAQEAIRIVESVQWCSSGVLARELRIDLASSRSLLEALESDGRLPRYSGMLPPGHDGAWLPEEEDCEEPLVFWHLRYPEGKALAKARIGSATPRSVAESLLADFLDRVRTANDDPSGSHTVERVTLYGSLTDPSRHEVSDVDLLVYARRRSRGTDSEGAPGDPTTPGGGNHEMLPEDEAVGPRMRLEASLRAGDERLDASVVDESFDNPRPPPHGAVEIEVFRQVPSAGGQPTNPAA